MGTQDDPEARIRELERSLNDVAGQSEVGAANRGGYYPPAPPPVGYGASFPPPPPPLRGTTAGPRVLLLIVPAVVAVCLVVIGVSVAVFLSRPSSLSSGRSTTSAASTRPSATTSRPTSTTPSRTSTAQSGPLQRLYDVLPQGYDSNNCSQVNTPNPQALVTVECGQTSNHDSPKFAAFTLYRDASGLAKAFQDGVDEDTVTPCPGGGASPTTWDSDSAPGVAVGSILCGKYKNEADLVWTRNSDLLLGDIQGPDIKALHHFWQYNLD